MPKLTFKNPQGPYSTGPLVIDAKNRLKWARKRANPDPGKDAVREEMTLWAMTWLENPAAFPLWIELRERAGHGTT